MSEILKLKSERSGCRMSLSHRQLPAAVSKDLSDSPNSKLIALMKHLFSRIAEFFFFFKLKVNNQLLAHIGGAAVEAILRLVSCLKKLG